MAKIYKDLAIEMLSTYELVSDIEKHVQEIDATDYEYDDPESAVADVKRDILVFLSKVVNDKFSEYMTETIRRRKHDSK